MSRPTSKKESKELLEFFNSIQKENEQDLKLHLWSEIIGIIYFIFIVFFLSKVFGY